MEKKAPKRLNRTFKVDPDLYRIFTLEVMDTYGKQRMTSVVLNYLISTYLESHNKHLEVIGWNYFKLVRDVESDKKWANKLR